jgi:hypothetical protein
VARLDAISGINTTTQTIIADVGVEMARLSTAGPFDLGESSTSVRSALIASIHASRAVSPSGVGRSLLTDTILARPAQWSSVAPGDRFRRSPLGRLLA